LRLDLGVDRPKGVDRLDSGTVDRGQLGRVVVAARWRIPDLEVDGGRLVGQAGGGSGERSREDDNDGAGRDHDASAHLDLLSLSGQGGSESSWRLIDG
jgi:hypothetical protein